MLGLRGVAFSLHLQELASAVTWALSTYASIDPAHIAAAGYS